MLEIVNLSLGGGRAFFMKEGIMKENTPTKCLWFLSYFFLVHCGKNAEYPPKTKVELNAFAESVVAVVMPLSSPDGSVPTKNYSLCSGTLVSANLVLTARHCVSRMTSKKTACTPLGESIYGARWIEDSEPTSVKIYTGRRVFPSQEEADAYAVRMIRPARDVLCDSDIAFLVLGQKLDSVPTLNMRQYMSVMEHDEVVPIGYSGGKGGTPGIRVVREVGEVLSVGPKLRTRHGAVLGPREFEVSEATCEGDSGGPAVDVRTGEVVGVISRGASCSSQGNHIYTQVAAYMNLRQMALSAAAEEASRAESQFARIEK